MRNVHNVCYPIGTSNAKQMGLTNVKLEVKDIASINEYEKQDLITAFDLIHDQAQPAKVLKGIYNALRNKAVGPRDSREKPSEIKLDA
jgi:hypothetical protein